MQMHRFFVEPEAIVKGSIRLTDAQAAQIVNVLRMTIGHHFQVLDNSGWQYEAEISEISSGVVIARVINRTLVTTEPHTRITLYQGLLKAAKFELVLQKCTELGAAGFVPMITERSVIGNLSDVSEGKIERWNRIISEAAEQSGRGKLPVLRPAIMYDQACEQSHGLSLLAWEGERTRTIKAALQSNQAQAHTPATKADTQSRSGSNRPFAVNIFLGPEGGFSSTEVELAIGYGLIPVSLGQRVLRAETAAITATALVLYELGDMGF